MISFALRDLRPLMLVARPLHASASANPGRHQRARKVAERVPSYLRSILLNAATLPNPRRIHESAMTLTVVSAAL